VFNLFGLFHVDDGVRGVERGAGPNRIFAVIPGRISNNDRLAGNENPRVIARDRKTTFPRVANVHIGHSQRFDSPLSDHLGEPKLLTVVENILAFNQHDAAWPHHATQFRHATSIKLHDVMGGFRLHLGRAIAITSITFVVVLEVERVMTAPRRIDHRHVQEVFLIGQIAEIVLIWMAVQVGRVKVIL
jgi:hypothetical protein